MKLDWLPKSCIICGETAAPTPPGRLTEEHIIPASLGGRLTCPFLCVHHNNRPAGQNGGDLKFEPNVIIALSNVRSRLPHLPGHSRQTRAVRTKARWIETSLDGSVIKPKGKDGSLTLSEEDAKKLLRKEFKATGGYSDEEIERAQTRFDCALLDRVTPVSKELAVIRESVIETFPGFLSARSAVGCKGQELVLRNGNGTALLKMAYGYLALHLGRSIFSPGLDAIRKAIDEDDPTAFPAEIGQKRWKPGDKVFHGLALHQEENGIAIQIVLLGQAEFVVRLPGIGLKATRRSYTHDLESGAENWGKIK